jgi:hypothetical protein
MKVSGTTRSLLQGVSQQTPHERGPGQHTQQVNMLADPVRGLVRRHGSVLQAEAVTGLATADYNNMVLDTENYRTFRYTHDKVDYDLMVRREAASSTLPVVLVYNRTAGTWLNVVRPTTNATLDLLQSGGVSAITNVGKYVFMAGNTIVPTATTGGQWSGSLRFGAVWVKGGAAERTYKVVVALGTLIADRFVGTYTTPSPTFPGTFDLGGVSLYMPDTAGGTETTVEAAWFKADAGGFGRYELANWNFTPTALSVTGWTNVHPSIPANGTSTYRWDSSNPRYLDVPLERVNVSGFWFEYTHLKVVPNPGYTAAVNEITSAYNLAATAWIEAAATQSTPAYIAEQLRASLVAAGLPTACISANNNHLFITSVPYSVAPFKDVSIEVSDGGDGSLITAVADEVGDVAELTKYHFKTKVVKVRPAGGAEVFYMQATLKDKATTGITGEVQWTEGTGDSRTIGTMLCYGTVEGNTFYMAQSAASLQPLLPSAPALADIPTYVRSSVGDTDSDPTPYFIGRRIDYLGTFQDRLVVGAAGTLRFSRSSDPLNFFRSTVLTLPGSDALEMSSQGNEADTIRHGVLYEQNLVLFGDRNQYVVSGKTVLTPTSAAMPVLSSHRDAAETAPLSAGGSIWYAQNAGSGSSLHTIQPGQVSDSPESFGLSDHLDDYLSGAMIEMADLSKPSNIFCRTTGHRNGVFLYTYLDRPGKGRVQGAWHRWDFGADLGHIVGMTPTPEGLILYSLRVAGGEVWKVADLVPLTAGLSTRPHLDSQRPYTDVLAELGSIVPTTPGDFHTVFSTGARNLIGSTLGSAPTLLTDYPDGTGAMTGCLFSSEFSPTNPYMSNRQDPGEVYKDGLLVVTSLTAYLDESSGMTTSMVVRGGPPSVKSYTARVVGGMANVVGSEPVRTYRQTLPIGKSNTDYEITLKSRTWMPFNLTSLTWAGQSFNRTQRA